MCLKNQGKLFISVYLINYNNWFMFIQLLLDLNIFFLKVSRNQNNLQYLCLITKVLCHQHNINSKEI